MLGCVNGPRALSKTMKSGAAQKFSNAILSCAAGFASFIFSLSALLYLTSFDEKIVAALVAGVFCLLISYIASERPNSESSKPDPFHPTGSSIFTATISTARGAPSTPRSSGRSRRESGWFC